jgi:hypothetical protein
MIKFTRHSSFKYPRKASHHFAQGGFLKTSLSVFSMDKKWPQLAQMAKEIPFC